MTSFQSISLFHRTITTCALYCLKNEDTCNAFEFTDGTCKKSNKHTFIKYLKDATQQKTIWIDVSKTTVTLSIRKKILSMCIMRKFKVSKFFIQKSYYKIFWKIYSCKNTWTNFGREQQQFFYKYINKGGIRGHSNNTWHFFRLF